MHGWGIGQVCVDDGESVWVGAAPVGDGERDGASAVVSRVWPDAGVD